MQILPLEMSIHVVETGLKAPQKFPVELLHLTTEKMCVAHGGVSILEAQHSSILPSQFQKKRRIRHVSNIPQTVILKAGWLQAAITWIHKSE